MTERSTSGKEREMQLSGRDKMVSEAEVMAGISMNSDFDLKLHTSLLVGGVVSVVSL